MTDAARPEHAATTERLTREEGADVARACVDAAGLGDRVQIGWDERAAALTLSGPDQFGMMGMTAYVTVRVAVPASRRAIGIAAARHALGEFYATDGEIAERVAELPFALAVLVAPDGAG